VLPQNCRRCGRFVKMMLSLVATEISMWSPSRMRRSVELGRQHDPSEIVHLPLTPMDVLPRAASLRRSPPDLSNSDSGASHPIMPRSMALSPGRPKTNERDCDLGVSTFTTPIYYVNDVPHIGTRRTTTVAADVVRRAFIVSKRHVYFPHGSR